MEPTIQPIKYTQYLSGETIKTVEADVIVETPVSLTLNGDSWLTFMCTPVDLEALAIGFLYNEGVINSFEEIEDTRICASGDNIDIWLNHDASIPEKWSRTSGCTGGFTSIENYELKGYPLNGGTVSDQAVNELVARLFDSQEIYRLSGGVHTSALSDGKNILAVAEDIGRHNTLDKLAGKVLMQDIISSRKIIMTTGRISSEMLQKSARLGASTVISRTSPSSLSITMAEKYGITLIGYARRNRFNVYAHPERIISISNRNPNKEQAIFS